VQAVAGRVQDITGESKPSDAVGGCPFCRIPSLDDEAGLVVAPRRATAYAVLNLYPYNPAT
jgi:ATP adenylyltransferase